MVLLFSCLHPRARATGPSPSLSCWGATEAIKVLVNAHVCQPLLPPPLAPPFPGGHTHFLSRPRLFSVWVCTCRRMGPDHRAPHPTAGCQDLVPLPQCPRFYVRVLLTSWPRTAPLEAPAFCETWLSPTLHLTLSPGPQNRAACA